MASVKWLKSIEVSNEKFEGYQMKAYTYRNEKSIIPVTKIKVRSLFIPPGVPSFYSRERYVEQNKIYQVFGRAWAGDLKIASVQYSVDGGKSWNDCSLLPNQLGKYAWTAFTFDVKDFTFYFFIFFIFFKIKKKGFFQ